MRLGSLVVVGLSVLLGQLAAQDCAAVARIVPAGAVSGTLDAGSCQLVDGTPYAPYRLDLPVRGQTKFDLTGSTDVLLALRDAAGNKVNSGAGFARAIEAGSYTVLLNGVKPGQTGDYTVTTTFTAEAGMLCANFPNIGRRHVVNGLLPSSGCLAPDGSPYEAYTLTTDGPGTLTVTVDSTDFTPVIAVRSIDGRQLAMQAAGPVSILLAADSQYLIVIGSSDKGDKTGAYRVTTDFQSAGNGSCLSRKTFTGSDSDTTSIGADSCFLTLAASGDPSYFNYYILTLPSPGLVDATAISGDFNATLNLQDAGGNLLASNTGGGGYDTKFNVSSNLREQLPAGTYRLYIVSDTPSGGAYSLKYTFTGGNPKPCTPAALNFGDVLNGAFSVDSCRTSIGISDVYTLTVPTSGTVDLVSTSALNTIIVIRDSKDNLIVRNNEGDGIGDSHITADLPAGTYGVVAAVSSGSGNYQLAARFTPHDIPPCAFAQSLELNGGYVQRLGPGSCRASNGQPVDYYTFTLSTDALVLAVTTSSEVDGFLTLYDASGNVLRTDDNTYGSRDPLIVQYVPAGTYKLAARDTTSTVGGLYQIDLRTTTAAPRPPFCTARSSLTPGATATGVIAYTGCQYTDNTFADLYRINLAADATLDIRADSSEFDAYLILLDSKGAVIDEDDDSGGNTNARINRAMAAGTYTIVVKPLRDYTSHGRYTLTTK